MKKQYSIAAIILGSLALSGCASNANFEQMVAHPVNNFPVKNTHFIRNVAVEQMQGGQETNPLFGSKINDAGFKLALTQSLQEANLLHELEGAHYILDAKLVKLQQPVVGFNLTVVCEVNYLLRNANTNATLFNQSIETAFTAKMSDSPLAIYRLKIANEGAARANIRKFIAALSQLPKTS